jgi:hypothetical protein
MKILDITACLVFVAFSLIGPLGDPAADDKSEKAATTTTSTQKGTTMTLTELDKKEDELLQPEVEQKRVARPSQLRMPIYKPPLLGAPAGRLSGGTRGIKDNSSTLFLLAPDHVGLTVQEQPSLYWFTSEPVICSTKIIIIDSTNQRILLEKVINPPFEPGIYCFRLADYGRSLERGVQYNWIVELVSNPECRSEDIGGSRVIKYIDSPETLRSRLAQADEFGTPHIYAEAGIWYDALSAISDLIDTAPRDPVLRKMRAFLLEQIGFLRIAQYEIEQSLEIEE